MDQLSPIPNPTYSHHPSDACANVVHNRTHRCIYPAQQDIAPYASGYHSLMDRIEGVRRGFAQRLFELRGAKGVSAREMSLALGQGQGYISNLENGHNLPSMAQFFAICEYLGVMPSEFFAFATAAESEAAELHILTKSLDLEDKQILLALARRLNRKD